MTSGPQRFWSRRLRRTFLFLLLGLGTTWGVAWAAGTSPAGEGERVYFSHYQPEWLFVTPPGWPKRALGLNKASRLCYDMRYVSITDTITTSPDDGDTFHQRIMRIGFPLRCLEHRQSMSIPRGEYAYDEGLSLIDRGIRLDSSAADSVFGPRLPLRPIWPGLAFNTVFYAVLWWLPFASVGMVRLNRRYRRGLCPICRYDLKADYSGSCPECGQEARQ